MKRIVLFCGNGFTTAMVSKKLEKAIQAHGYNYTSAAFPYSELKDEGAKADIILLAPQIRFNLNRVKQQFPDTPVLLLDMRTYATLEGDEVMKQVVELIGE